MPLTQPLPTPPPRPDPDHQGDLVLSLRQYGTPQYAVLEEATDNSPAVLAKTPTLGEATIKVHVHAADGTYLGDLKGDETELTKGEQTSLFAILDKIRGRIKRDTTYKERRA